MLPLSWNLSRRATLFADLGSSLHASRPFSLDLDVPKIHIPHVTRLIEVLYFECIPYYVAILVQWILMPDDDTLRTVLK